MVKALVDKLGDGRFINFFPTEKMAVIRVKLKPVHYHEFMRLSHTEFEVDFTKVFLLPLLVMSKHN